MKTIASYAGLCLIVLAGYTLLLLCPLIVELIGGLIATFFILATIIGLLLGIAELFGEHKP